MGNSFGTRQGQGRDLYLTNGGTDVFFDVMTLAGSALAQADWDQHLVLFFADGQRRGFGWAGFDLADLPWSADFTRQRRFILDVIDRALERYGWDRLSYDPPNAAATLERFREMVADFVPHVDDVPADLGEWELPPPPEFLERCPEHRIFVGEHGCRLCEGTVSSGPVGAVGGDR